MVTLVVILLVVVALLLVGSATTSVWAARKPRLGPPDLEALVDEECAFETWANLVADDFAAHLVGRAPFTRTVDQTPRGVEIHFFECITELVGGRADGAEVFSGYEACLTSICGKFESMPHLSLHCDILTCVEEELSPYVAVEGVIRGKPVKLYLHTEPLPGTQPTWREREDGSTEPVEPPGD